MSVFSCHSRRLQLLYLYSLSYMPVSYTHLRQELYHRFTVGKLMTSAPARLYDTDSMEPVSYTHLDVYKRQL